MTGYFEGIGQVGFGAIGAGAGGIVGAGIGGGGGALAGGGVGTLIEPGGGTLIGAGVGGYEGAVAGGTLGTAAGGGLGWYAGGGLGRGLDWVIGTGDSKATDKANQAKGLSGADQGKCAGHCVANEASDGDIKKLSDKELDKAAKANGYDDAHDLKNDYGLDSKSDIGVDKAGNLYSGPRIKGQGGFQPLGINKGGS